MKKTAALALFAAFAITQAVHGQDLELVAGWDTFAFDPANRAPTAANGADGTFAVTDASSDNQHMNGQTDGTWGSLDLTPAPATTQDASTVVSRFVNGNNPSYEFTVTDTSGTARDLGFFAFDGGSFRPRSARTWELSVISGDLTPGVIASGRIDPGAGFVGDVLGIWTNVDVDLSGLADNTLDANGTVVFGLTFTGGGLNDDGEVAVDDETGEPLSNGGHHGYLDNVAVGTGELPDTAVAGDFNEDGVVDCADLDGYVGNIGAAATGTLAALDIDGDGTLSAADASAHITTLVVTMPNGVTGTFPGDLNCDGTVNVLGDAFALVGNLGNAVTSYSQGDINFDGTVNVLGDAFALVGNLGMSNQ